jgi:hypothetical protein
VNAAGLYQRSAKTTSRSTNPTRSVFSDWVGPRYALTIGVTLQAIVGFGMAGGYEYFVSPAHHRRARETRTDG